LQTHQSVWAVVPAYNEGSIIARSVADLLQVIPNVVVVDDCSDDETRLQAASAGAHVCRHPVNLGQGAALQTGIDYALRQQADCIVTFDADGQHDARDAVRMIEVLTNEGCDVVLASRFLGQAHGLTATKRMFLRLAVTFTRWTTHLAVTDTHNGLRVLSRSAAKRIRLRENRMAHASEVLEQIAEKHLSYVEVPCTITYSEYSIRKGQRMSGAFAILSDLALRKLNQ
jgi:glycosyltransferase involved in cell wall biosynthesis